MCTVIYIPQKNGALFSSCRDEHPGRLTIPPKIKLHNDTRIVYPQDKEKGGTWIGATENGTAVILLNGGFERHVKTGNYAKSRGLIALALLGQTNVVGAWTGQSLMNIEPFTLIVWQTNKLYQLIWDGQRKYKKQLDVSKPAIWSSATLYDNASVALRNTWFNKVFCNLDEINEETLLHFLLQHNDPQNGFVMHRSDALKTVSISMMRLQTKKVCLTYYDLVNQTNTTEHLQLTDTPYATEMENIPDKN